MKYMFATLCSKPAATNAAIGGTIARIRSVVVRALKVSQTARQTRALQACERDRLHEAGLVFVAAIERRCPTAPPPNVYCSRRRRWGRRDRADEVRQTTTGCRGARRWRPASSPTPSR
jgi:hypothetical protein